ncbi:MAG: hypothetical protein KDE22_16655 [Rhodobacterales bacterium]|nr:hypothetical protein [Rhodobacterales bacterium]
MRLAVIIGGAILAMVALAVLATGLLVRENFHDSRAAFVRASQDVIAQDLKARVEAALDQGHAVDGLGAVPAVARAFARLSGNDPAAILVAADGRMVLASDPDRMPATLPPEWSAALGGLGGGAVAVFPTGTSLSTGDLTLVPVTGPDGLPAGGLVFRPAAAAGREPDLGGGLAGSAALVLALAAVLLAFALPPLFRPVEARLAAMGRSLDGLLGHPGPPLTETQADTDEELRFIRFQATAQEAAERLLEAEEDVRLAERDA